MWRWRRRRGHWVVPGRFHDLDTYNGERARGVVHTVEIDARMRALQADFDAWRDRQIARDQAIADGIAEGW
jgi:hypothetical protein